MAIVFEIPLTPQSQTVKVTLDARRFLLSITWRDGLYYLDMSDGTIVINGIALVAGCDLLEQYKHHGLSGALVVQTEGDAYANPAYNTLGNQSHLLYITP